MSALGVSTRQPSLKALFVSPVILGRWSEGLKAKEDDGPGLALLASGFQLLRFLAQAGGIGLILDVELPLSARVSGASLGSGAKSRKHQVTR